MKVELQIPNSSQLRRPFPARRGLGHGRPRRGRYRIRLHRGDGPAHPEDKLLTSANTQRLHRRYL